MSCDVNSLHHLASITPNKMADNDMSFRQRVVIEFLAKEEIPAAEIHQRLQRAYGSVCMGASSVRRWVKHFKNGNTSIQDEPRSGRRRTASTERNKERMDEIIQDDRRVTVDTIARTLGIGHNAVQEMIEGAAAWTTLWDNGGNSESSASVSSDGWNGVLPQGHFQTSRTLGEMCTKKWRLCGKIKKGM